MTHSELIIYKSRAWSILANSYKQKKQASTYLFFGPKGIGRWQTAILFTALLNCETPRTNESDRQYPQPCGECRNCRNIFKLNFEGLKIALPIPPHENKLEKAIELTSEFMEEKRQEPFKILSSTRSVNIPIALAREIKKSLSLKAGSDIKRVVIFYQMEEMNFTAADALLKMIEEPPADTVIILICDNPESLLPTIQSRSQKIKIDNNKVDDIEKYLIENYHLSENQASLLANISEGSIGRAIDSVEIQDELHKARRAEMFLIFKSLFNETGGETLAHMNDLLNFRDKSETMELLRLWQLLIRDCNRFAITQNEDELLNIDFKKDIIALSKNFTTADLSSEMISNIKNTLADLDRNVHIQGALMALALKLKMNIKTAMVSR